MKAKEMERLIRKLEGKAMAYAYHDADMAREQAQMAAGYQIRRDMVGKELAELWTQIHAGLAEGVEP